MKKIVINTKHGGFGLSAAAVKKYLELSGKECHFFKTGTNTNDVQPITLEEATQNTFWTAFTVPSPEQYLNLTKPWAAFSQTEQDEFNDVWDSIAFYSTNLDRDDEKLVQVVEELGETANCEFSQLKIVEIPEDVEWYIQDYDGVEWIAEKHRTWN